MKILTISRYARSLGIHPQTLRKLECEGVSPYIQPFRTHGGHRR
jgi:DNA-binding transcriptional MerR regulator